MTTTSPPTLAQIRKRDEQTTSLSDIAVLHDRRELLRLLDEAHAQIDGLMKRLAAAEENATRDNWGQEFFALRNALRDWPNLPPAYVLMWLDGKFSEDWERGVRMQRELGLSVIPPKTECEIGAGMWDRLTNGAWKASQGGGDG